MKTISGIKTTMDLLERRVRLLCKEERISDDEYKEKLGKLLNEQLDFFKELRMIDPIMVPLITKDESSFTNEEANVLFDKLLECTKKREELSLVFTGACASYVIQRNSFAIPKYINFAKIPHVLIWPYQDQSWEDFAVRMMNQIVLGSLLSLPLGKIRTTFINPSLSHKASFFTGKVSPEICRAFVETNEINSYIDSLTDRLKNYLKNGKIGIEGLPDYELVVLLDYPYMFDNITERMRLIIEQGGQAGIHFIVLNDLRRTLENKDTYDILSQKQLFAEFGAFEIAKQEDYDLIYTFTYELASQPALLDLCFKYLNSDLEESSSSKTEVFTDKEYATVENGLSVLIGKPIDKKTIEFSLGQDGHVHSFIIGQSGSGKSVLLHDIILEAIKKYSPEDLQLYLLDCKLGGVEFNRYKDVKHARALLVDNSDNQVILEILRDLREQMQERGKALREAGVQNIDDYNRSHNQRMSRIWVVIDECHVLFEQHSTSERKARAEMIDIITKVATEGRSQGVHLIMATQTLANADIPTAILNNITDRYILNCAPIDAEKMWPNSSKLIGNLGVGDALYHNTMGRFPDTQFHAFYLSKEDAELQIRSAVTKSDGHLSNGQFYFNGSQLFYFDQNIMDTLSKIRKDNLKACMGKSISLNQVPVTITLKQDMSENILLTGIDEKGQSIRTAIDLLFSLVASNLQAGLNYKFYVLNFRDDDEAEYQDVIEQLEDSGLIDVVRKREIGSLLKRIAESINNENAEPSILILLGQQRFRELKLDAEIVSTPKNNDAFGPMNFTFSDQAQGTSIKTYKDALNYILDYGPDYHVHTILQIDKPDNLLFEDYVTSKFVLKKFRHIIMLRSDEKAAMKMGIPDDIRLETLNSEPERLRAIYYADGDEGWTLFSPFAMPNKDLISNITNKE